MEFTVDAQEWIRQTLFKLRGVRETDCSFLGWVPKSEELTVSGSEWQCRWTCHALGIRDVCKLIRVKTGGGGTGWSLFSVGITVRYAPPGISVN